MKIWCLFSVANNYDQPPHNLVAWWPEKPSFAEVAGCMGLRTFPCATDEQTLAIVSVWQGQTVRSKNDDTDYSLAHIGPGRVK